MVENSVWKSFLSLVIAPLLFSCMPNGNVPKEVTDQPEEVQYLTTEDSAMRAEVIDRVDDLLFNIGNYNIEVVDQMVSDKAMIGISVLREGEWSNLERTIGEYFENVRSREPSPYSEIPSSYEIMTTEGRMALVKADGIVYKFGVPRNREVNHFTMMKEKGEWIFLNVSFTAERIPEEDQIFDPAIFARSYAQVWGSQRPRFVSAFFTEDGSLQVNEGEPAVGRDAISEVAQGFMTEFSDLRVYFDSLVTQQEGTEFHWTLTGTNDGPKGTGNKVRISGYELWQLNEDGLIQSSKGFFSSEEYSRQIEFGVENTL